MIEGLVVVFGCDWLCFTRNNEDVVGCLVRMAIARESVIVIARELSDGACVMWYPGLDSSNTLDNGDQWVVAQCKVSVPCLCAFGLDSWFAACHVVHMNLMFTLHAIQQGLSVQLDTPSTAFYTSTHNPCSTVVAALSFMRPHPQAKGASTTLPSVNEPASIHISSLATGRLLAAVAAAAGAAGAGLLDSGSTGACCQEGGVEEGGGHWEKRVTSSPNKQRARALTGAMMSISFIQ